MASTACKPVTLLTANTCDIQYCPDCEMVNLTMGSMTLRLPTDHFRHLSKDLAKGVAKLDLQGNSSVVDLHEHRTTTLHS